MYCVYKHYCPYTKKSYIGLTKFENNPNKRWANGKGYQENQPFYDDILKYGWDNFTHEILAKNLAQKEAYQLEAYYIKLYNSANPKYGYNRSNGNGPPRHLFGYMDSKGRLRSTSSRKDNLIHYIHKYNKYYG